MVLFRMLAAFVVVGLVFVVVVVWVAGASHNMTIPAVRPNVPTQL